MTITVNVHDDDARRVAPCGKNAEHDHKECVRKFIEGQLNAATFQPESERAKQAFIDGYVKPGIVVTVD